MRNFISRQSNSHPVTLFLLTGSIILGLAQIAGAFATTGSANTTSGETCAFTVQLQTSVAAQRDYLVKVEEAIGPRYSAGNAIDDMYGNIVPASYTEDEGYDTIGTLSQLFGSASNTTAGTTNLLDPFSVECMSCHDGVAASSIQVDLRDRPFDRQSWVNSSSSDHPVGMTYDAYVGANRGYKAVGSDTKMIFVNGKVGCLTCHDPLNADKGHLVMSDANSALCRTCHDK